MDGSRIEGSHKGWNSLQRAHSSGIEVYTGLAFDFFLRRNIRIGWSRVESGRRTINLYEFVESTFSSHHVQLVNHTANVFNSLLQEEPANLVSKNRLHAYPTLPLVKVHESMGLVESAHTQTFGGLIEAEAPATSSEIHRLDARYICLKILKPKWRKWIKDNLFNPLTLMSRCYIFLWLPKTRPPSRNPPTADETIPQQQKRKVGCAEYQPMLTDDAIQDQVLTSGHSEDTPSDPKRRLTASASQPEHSS